MYFDSTDLAEPAAIVVRSIQPSLVSVTHSLKRQTRSRNVQRWEIELSYPPLSRADFMPLYAFMLGKKGQFDTFTVKPTVYKDAAGNVTSCTSAVEDAGVEVVTVTLNGTLKAGDFVKFASHSKVYMVTADATGNGVDTEELSIQPPLEEATTAAAVTFDDVPFTVSNASDVNELQRGAVDLHNFSLKLVENV